MKQESRDHMNFVAVEENALMDFQFALLDAMKEKGVSQVELAEKLGVTRARISQLLSSDANPTLKLVGRALSVLGIKAEYIDLNRADARHIISWDFDSFGAENSLAIIAHRAFQSSKAWGLDSEPANENYAECVNYEREAA
jgi:transcriptional regulator with XRE-family HTH domain